MASMASKASEASSLLCSHSFPKAKRAAFAEINPLLTCVLCGGYFIDATTIVECLHSFCKSCIVRYLETSTSCPICDAPLHKTKPFLSIRADKTLQDIVYKLVPGLFKSEMTKRKSFFAFHPEAADCCSAEDRGEIGDHKMFYTPQDKISLSLEYGFGENQMPANGYPIGKQAVAGGDRTADVSYTNRRYLLCPAGMQIALLKKFVAQKYGLSTHFKVDIMYLEDVLSDEYNLMDVAYIYSWRRNNPLRLFYRVTERPAKQMKRTHLESEIVPFDTETKNNRPAKKLRCSVSVSVPTSAMTTTTSSVPKSACNESSVKSASTVATLRNIRVSSETRKVSPVAVCVAKTANSSLQSRTSPPRPQTLVDSRCKDSRKNDEKSEKSEKRSKSDHVDKCDRVNNLILNRNRHDASRSVCAPLSATSAITSTTSMSAGKESHAANGNAKCINATAVGEERKVPSLKICTSKANECVASSSPRRVSPPFSQTLNNCDHKCEKNDRSGNFAKDSFANKAKIEEQRKALSKANDCSITRKHQQHQQHHSSVLPLAVSVCDQKQEKIEKVLCKELPNKVNQKLDEPKKQLKASNVHSIIEYLQESKKSPKSPKSPTSGCNAFVGGGEIGVNFHSSVTSKGITIVRDVNRNSVASSSATTITSPSNGTTVVSIADTAKSTVSPPSITSTTTSSSKKVSAAVAQCNAKCSVSIEKIPLPHRPHLVSESVKKCALNSSPNRSSSVERLALPLKIPSISNPVNCKSADNKAKAVDGNSESADDKSIACTTETPPIHPLTPSPSTCDSISDTASLASPVKDNIGALDLSFGSRSNSKTTVTTTVQRTVVAERQKHVANPPVLDKHRFLCPPRVNLYAATHKQHPSFKIAPNVRPVVAGRPSIASHSSTAPKKDQTICNASAGDSAANAFANIVPARSNHHHHHHHHHRKSQPNLTVITPDPHSHHPKIVIKNLDPR